MADKAITNGGFETDLKLRCPYNPTSSASDNVVS